MKVNIVVNSFPAASETFLYNLVVGLEEKGLDVCVCAISKNNDKKIYADKIDRWSGKIRYYNIRGVKGVIEALIVLIVNFKTFLTLFLSEYGFTNSLKMILFNRFVSFNKPDWIHIAYSGIGVYFIEELKFVKQKNKKSCIMVSCRGTAEKVKPIVDRNRGQRLSELFNLVDKVHCVSNDMANGLYQHGLDKRKCFVNYPSIDPDNFNRDSIYETPKNNTWTFSTTGRLHFQKGYLFALLAMRKIKESGIDFVYNIIGGGEDELMLKYFIHEFGLGENVVLHGKISNAKVKEILHKTHIFLLPSVYEGVANAALEALAMGIPIITTNSGGMEEVITHKENGLIVERFDPESIYNSLIELINDRNFCQLLSGTSRTLVENKFNLERQISIFYKQYLHKCDPS